QHEELLGEGIGQHGAWRVAARDHDVVEALCPGDIEHGAAAGYADHPCAAVHGLLHGGEGFLRIPAVAAGDHQAALAYISGQVVVAMHSNGAGCFRFDQLRHNTATDPASPQAGDH